MPHKYLSVSSNSTEGADLIQKECIAGIETKVLFNNPKNDISGISFKARKYSGMVGIRVEAIDANKTDIIGEANRKAYRYVKILIGNEAFESSENIAGGSIEFRVPKNWVKENGIDPGTINLNRMEDNGWKLLGTKLTKEDGDFYYFRAETPGFSYFAITGKQQAVITPVEKLVAASELKTENLAEVVKNETAKGQASTGTKEKSPGFEIVLSGACGLLALACFKRK